MTVKEDGHVVGTCAWVDDGHRLEIDNIYVFDERPNTLAKMFQAFKRRYAGRFVVFRARNDNEQMARFAKLVGAEETGRVFTVQLKG